MKQNITLKVDKDLLRKVRVIAARKETSVTQLLSEELEQLVKTSENYVRAKREAQADLAAGFHFGGERTVTREELHER